MSSTVNTVCPCQIDKIIALSVPNRPFFGMSVPRKVQISAPLEFDSIHLLRNLFGYEGLFQLGLYPDIHVSVG